METKIKYIKRSTPIRNAILVCSLTCNLFLGYTAHAIYSGRIALQVNPEPVELTQADYLTKLTTKR